MQTVDIPQIIDIPREAKKKEFAVLDVWKRSVQYKLTRHEDLAKEIKSWYDDAPADAAILERVGDYDLQIGVRTNQNHWVSLWKVYKAVGSLKAFFGVCDVTFKALSEKIGKLEAEALQVETQTGSRRLKAFVRVEPAAVEPAA